MATASPPTEAGRGAHAARRPSLRRRLALAFTLLALLIALGQAVFVWYVGYRAEEKLIDRVVAGQLSRSMALHWQQPGLAAPNTPDMSLYVLRDGDGTAEAALPPWLRDLPRQPGSYEVRPGQGLEYHVGVARDRDAWFYLAYDVDEHENRQRNEIAALALSVLVVAVVAALASRRLARGMTRDLDRLASEVAGDRRDASTGGSLGALAAHSETGRLADALDGYRERLRGAMARERAFSAAASHELRTPLMRAGSSLDLLRSGELDARQRRLVAHVQASLDEMTMLTGALLRVARGQVDSAASEVVLEALADKAIAHLEPEARSRGISLRAELPGATRLDADRSALWIVLTNLLRNAIRHSQGTRVVVGWRDGQLIVEDDGVGIGDGAKEAGAAGVVGAAVETPAPDRPRPGGAPDEDRGLAANLGIGLAIVERVCEAAGWRLEVAPRTGGGTRVTVAIASG